MVQDVTAKISNFLSNCAANAAALKAARDQARQLAEEFTNDAAVNALADGHCVGNNSHLTRAIVVNYMTVVQPAVDTAITNRIVGIEAMLSQ